MGKEREAMGTILGRWWSLCKGLNDFRDIISIGQARE